VTHEIRTFQLQLSDPDSIPTGTDRSHQWHQKSSGRFRGDRAGSGPPLGDRL